MNGIFILISGCFSSVALGPLSIRLLGCSRLRASEVGDQRSWAVGHQSSLDDRDVERCVTAAMNLDF